MPDSFKSLLPPNSTPLELAADHIAESITTIAFPNTDLFNPQKCPAHLLGQLAWALSVDEWDDAWDEAIKRDVCQMSVEVHRHKGTVHAIETALNSLEASIDLVEWFSHGGAPYTATLTAYAGNNLTASGGTLLTPALQAKLWRVVAAAKNARTHIDFKIGIGATAALQTAACANTFDIARHAVATATDMPFSAKIYSHFAGRSFDIHRHAVALV